MHVSKKIETKSVTQSKLPASVLLSGLIRLIYNPEIILTEE